MDEYWSEESPLTRERIMFNEGEPRVAASNRRIELFYAAKKLPSLVTKKSCETTIASTVPTIPANAA